MCAGIWARTRPGLLCRFRVKPNIHSQRGETLIESLLAIAVLSIVATAAFAGLQVALRASAQHHEIAVAETLLRSAAEDLQDPTSTYVPLAGCPGHGNYTGLPARANYDLIDVSVRFWNEPSAATPKPWPTDFDAAGTCPGTDPGLQQVELAITTPSGYTQRLAITKRAS